ncbi:unnamed protein product [Caenorhabditis sp. 36 PRJEB53466]|nr:unnamed protein product [Caenorhabditis sp. 36 PRJEB53466]
MSDSEDEEAQLLAADGFPKYYMKKPAGGDPFEYARPPEKRQRRTEKERHAETVLAWTVIRILYLILLVLLAFLTFYRIDYLLEGPMFRERNAQEFHAQLRKDIFQLINQFFWPLTFLLGRPLRYDFMNTTGE